jgi:hypothetical protein
MSFGYEPQESSEDEFEEPEHATILILGRSKTGKSSLVRAIFKQYEDWCKPIYILNDRSFKSKYKYVTWSEVLNLRCAALVVEDIVACTNQQFKILSEILNYRVHHCKINPFINVCHSLLRQGLFGLLPFYTKIIITNSQANIASYKKLLNYFGFTEQEQAFHMKNFQSCKEKFAHWEFDVDERTIQKKKYPYVPETYVGKSDGKKRKKMSDDDDSGLSKRDSLTLARADRFFSVLPNAKEGKALFEILYAQLPKQCINPKTLDITLAKNSADGPMVRISLIQYVATLVDDEERVPASRDIMKFHRYVQTVRRIVLPAHFVLNKSLR